MKKLLAFAIAFFSFTAIFAQSRYDRHDNRNDNRNYGYGQGQARDVVLGRDSRNSGNVYNYPSRQSSNDRYDEQRRREEMDRVNRDYDRRINDYRNDRSINSYERDRRIRQAENERSEKLKSFAGGAVVGAIAGVLLGVVLSH